MIREKSNTTTSTGRASEVVGIGWLYTVKNMRKRREEGDDDGE